MYLWKEAFSSPPGRKHDDLEDDLVVPMVIGEPTGKETYFGQRLCAEVHQEGYSEACRCHPGMWNLQMGV
jgi:hypothetical protein